MQSEVHVPHDPSNSGAILSNLLDIEYVPSATVLRHLRSRSSTPLSQPRKDVLVLASESGDNRHQLEGAAREARFISRSYRNVKVLWSKSPSARVEFASSDPAPGIIHVSAHIVADSERPWRSGILWERVEGPQPFERFFVPSAAAGFPSPGCDGARPFQNP